MRINFFAVVGLLSAAVANAGQIQIGGVNGLTSNYITQGAGAVCAAGAGNCLAGSAGGFVERNYDLKLFLTAEEGSTAPVPYAGYTQTTAQQGTLGAFAMINDGLTGTNGNNFWDGVTSDSTITVPIGINNVSSVYTMLSNIWGTANTTDTVVTFDYGTSSNASSFNDVVVVDLINSPTGTSGNSGGQIQASIDCSTATICTNANGGIAASSTPSATLNGNPETLTILAANLFTSGNGYNGFTTAGAYSGSTGNLSLDAQDFLLSSIVAPSPSEWLVNVKVEELTGGTVSQTALSAITVNTTPEPSTVILFLGGLGALGLARFRFRRS
jgi:hypothetical protein